MDTLLAAFSDGIDRVFGPPLRAFFHPIDRLFIPISAPWWKACAVALFLCAILWVFSLRKEYVNLDAPRKNLWCDLRLWTVLALSPHITIYLWF